MRPTILEGRKVSLAVPMREDVHLLWRWYNDRAVRRYLTKPHEIFFFEDEMEWYEAIRREKAREKVFAIIKNEEKTLLGLIGLHNVDLHSGNAELGYFLGPEHWGKGYATEAVSLAITYAFEWLNLRKLYARVFSSNVASARVLEKNGFRLVGRLRKHQYVPGEGFVDVLIYELFRGE
ncbi:GNAT family N-acetyltransferase [Thermococcus gammatolerans]|uniref:N-acetyltransferase, GNAT family n=1 Tax=Thermococcus gammatolerans (strain DSM 15229 / JCM 11827 / EJ3) TaxID=593117 RepID=C5A6F5_THEGJ|nr:GNAT family protein [Thermococcus gammatolerans]ACS33817.1 N-acetyltransferase, GNAT family [Thermococcus gammatolerans EJ3]